MQVDPFLASDEKAVLVDLVCVGRPRTSRPGLCATSHRSMPMIQLSGSRPDSGPMLVCARKVLGVAEVVTKIVGHVVERREQVGEG